jgi:hypothetical protein
MYHVSKVKKETTKFLIELLNKENKENNKTTEIVDTVKGFQTKNIIKKIPIEFKKDILQNLFNIDDFFHLHLIKYEKGGFQKKHNHITSENFSFILYLNNSDGFTNFYFFDRQIKELPIENKIIFFKSEMEHEAEICNNNKKVAVGAIGKKFIC